MVGRADSHEPFSWPGRGIGYEYGVSNDAWAVTQAQLGLPDMRILSSLPPEALVENVMTARFTDGASLNPTQAVQIG